MKKNAVLIAGIMFVAGCASSQSERASYDSIYDSPSASVSASYSHDDISADSTKRGGSLDARGYDEDANNDELEGAPDPINPGKEADSSIRGGSVFARDRDWNHDSEPSSGVRDSERHMKADSSIRGGSMEARGAREARGDYENDVDVDVHSNFQGGSATSIGGAASAEVGEGSSSISLEEQQSEAVDRNSSEQLEENISGEYEIKTESPADKNESGSDTFSSITSEGTTDIHHDEADLNAIESAGAAASVEIGSSTSEDEFESNDPAMRRAGSPLGTAGGEPNFLYEDNRARGVGSTATGDFANAPVNQGAVVSDEQLAQRVKARLTTESTGTHGLMSSEIARNIQVSGKNGEITLTGTVPSEKHKDLIEIQAREISGVRHVNNQLMVTPEADAAVRDLRGSDLEDVTNELQD